MPIAQDIADLKANWLADPCYDLELAEGFEAHREELLAYRLRVEAAWEQRKQDRLSAKADELGCPGNVKLASYVERLERRIADLEGTD